MKLLYVVLMLLMLPFLKLATAVIKLAGKLLTAVHNHDNHDSQS